MITIVFFIDDTTGYTMEKGGEGNLGRERNDGVR
jgi:hypothetical protein